MAGEVDRLLAVGTQGAPPVVVVVAIAPAVAVDERLVFEGHARVDDPDGHARAVDALGMHLVDPECIHLPAAVTGLGEGGRCRLRVIDAVGHVFLPHLLHAGQLGEFVAEVFRAGEDEGVRDPQRHVASARRFRGGDGISLRGGRRLLEQAHDFAPALIPVGDRLDASEVRLVGELHDEEIVARLQECRLVVAAHA